MAAQQPELVGTRIASVEIEPSVSKQTVGTGIASVEIEPSLSLEHVMLALREKIVTPQFFLPVTDVVYRVSDDCKGTYREMSLGPNRIIENIYHNNKDIVRFVVVDDVNEHVNLIFTDPATGKSHLQFFKRNTTTLAPVHWPAPLAVAIGGIKKVLERARALAAGAEPNTMAP